MVGTAVYVPRAEQSDEDLRWMRVALDMAQEAFENDEVPVGSVFVQNGKAIAMGRNRTNELMNVRVCGLHVLTAGDAAR